MRLLIFVIALMSYDSFACVNWIADSTIAAVLAKTPNAGSPHCGPSDPCVCYDGVNWDTAIYDSKTHTFSVDPVKKAAKDQAKTADKKEHDDAIGAMTACISKLKNKIATAQEKDDCLLSVLTLFNGK